MALKFRVRPSSLLGDIDNYTAFCFDQACFYFLATIMSEVEKAGASTGKGDTSKKQESRKQRTLDKMLGIQPKFLDPRGMKNRKG